MHFLRCPCLLDYGYIAAAQQTDHLLMAKLDQDPLHFQWLTVPPQLCLIAHVAEPGDNPKICIPDALLNKFIQFYHMALSHTGMVCVVKTMALQFWHTELRKNTEQYIQKCEVCQQNKLPGRGYGLLAPKQAQLVPWHEVAVVHGK